MPFTWILLQCPSFAMKSSPYPSGFGYIIYCLAKENWQGDIKRLNHNHIHEWDWQLCERTHSYICVNCQILTGVNQNIIEWFSVYSLRSCFVENMAEIRFPEWAWMLFTWIPSQCPHFAGETEWVDQNGLRG